MSLGHQSIFLGSSGGGSFSFFEVTHAELLDLINTTSLVVGGYYLITDFQTIYDQPDYWLEGAPKEPHELITKTSPVTEPLLCIAVSINEISSEVYSTIYPKDVLQYDPLFQATEVKGTPAKGRIFYRKDDKNNVTGYDHRHVYFKRYLNLVTGSHIEYKDNGNESAEQLTFGFPQCSDNNLLSASQDLFFDFILPNNVFGFAFKQVFLGKCRNNFFSYCLQNIISGEMSENIVISSFSSNVITYSFNGNKLNAFYNNYTNSSFNGNTAAGYDGIIQNNIINDYIQNCQFSDFIGNTVNTFLAGENFTAATLVTANFTKTIYKDQLLGKRLNYYNNDVLTFANITD